MSAQRLACLAEIEAALWSELGKAVTDKTHAWRTPVLATSDADLADARTVVLRDVDERHKRLFIYTDQRAGKVRQILHQPRGTLVMWSRELGWQLRCRVRLTLEMSGLSAASRWALVKLTPAAQDYLSPLPPGAPLDAPDAALDSTISAQEAEASAPVMRDHFSVIDATIESLDWLELHRQGQRRAVFDAQGPRWIQP